MQATSAQDTPAGTSVFRLVAELFSMKKRVLQECFGHLQQQIDASLINKALFTGAVVIISTFMNTIIPGYSDMGVVAMIEKM